MDHYNKPVVTGQGQENSAVPHFDSSNWDASMRRAGNALNHANKQQFPFLKKSLAQKDTRENRRNRKTDREQDQSVTYITNNLHIGVFQETKTVLIIKNSHQYLAGLLNKTLNNVQHRKINK